MAGLISRWILSRVVRSALVFESEAIDAYRRMKDRLGDASLRDTRLRESLGHLLEEEQIHWKILEEAAKGRLSVPELEKVLAEHLYSGLPNIRALEAEELAAWGGELERSLAQEEKTLVFYGNLRRMSKIPAVKKAFEVLWHMEEEHLAILRKLLGRLPAESRDARS